MTTIRTALAFLLPPIVVEGMPAIVVEGLVQLLVQLLAQDPSDLAYWFVSLSRYV